MWRVFPVDFPPQFQSWESADPAELYDAPVMRKQAGGTVKQWSGRACPIEGCGFELCMCLVGAPPEPSHCVPCFNDPDWKLRNGEAPEDPVKKMDEHHKERQIKRMAEKSLVLECRSPDEHLLIDELTVSPDLDSDWP